MDHARTPFRALLVALALALVAVGCGSDTADVASGDGERAPAAQADGDADDPSQDPPPTTSPVEEPTSAPTAEPAPTEPVTSDLDDPDGADGDAVDDAPDAEDQPDDAPDEAMPETSEPAEEPPPADAPPVDGGWQRVDSAPNLLGPNVVQPDELFVADDGTTVVVRFWTGVPPCTLARVSVAEGPDAVQVMLEIGASPDAATITCIASVEPFEIVASLSEPIGDRELVAAVGAAGPPPGNPFQGAVFSTDQYLGLTVADAKELAAVEGRDLRIARVDDEYFALTQDFIDTRVNIEVEDDIVVAAFGG